jgi:hypothetical protein
MVTILSFELSQKMAMSSIYPLCRHHIHIYCHEDISSNLNVSSPQLLNIFQYPIYIRSHAHTSNIPNDPYV